jgi:hypothetical protein
MTNSQREFHHAEYVAVKHRISHSHATPVSAIATTERMSRRCGGLTAPKVA